jgi:hypothetical protein
MDRFFVMKICHKMKYYYVEETHVNETEVGCGFACNIITFSGSVADNQFERN